MRAPAHPCFSKVPTTFHFPTTAAAMRNSCWREEERSGRRYNAKDWEADERDIQEQNGQAQRKQTGALHIF